MKNRLLASAAIVMALTAPAWAQTTPPAASPPPASTDTAPPATTNNNMPSDTKTDTKSTGMSTPSTAATPSPESIISQQKAEELRANTLIGMRVRNNESENLGKINDLLMDDKGGVKAAVLSVGGFLGLGDKLVAVPWSNVKLDADSRSAIVSMSKEELKAAAPFKTKETAQAEAEANTARSRSAEPAPRPATPVR
jgi:sporulation protein YlmC with PRC-barrel domain